MQQLSHNHHPQHCWPLLPMLPLLQALRMMVRVATSMRLRCMVRCVVMSSQCCLPVTRGKMRRGPTAGEDRRGSGVCANASTTVVQLLQIRMRLHCMMRCMEHCVVMQKDACARYMGE